MSELDFQQESQIIKTVGIDFENIISHGGKQPNI